MPLLAARGQKLRPSRALKLSPASKVVDPFYLSPEWRALVAEIKRERWPHLMAVRGHCCEDRECKAMHTSRTRIFFDHVLERRDHPQLALVKSNIIGRCGASHTKKTLEARKQRYHPPFSKPGGG